MSASGWERAKRDRDNWGRIVADALANDVDKDELRVYVERYREVRAAHIEAQIERFGEVIEP